MKKNLLAWCAACRPKTLTAAFVPILVATFLAKHETGTVNGWLSFSAFLVASFIQIGTNLINDALDFKKGADTSDRLGPVRVTQSGALTFSQVLMAGFFCFLLAFLLGIPLIQVGGMPVLLLLLLSIICGYLYTGGPYPLAYVGLGDLFVLLFFGWALTCALFYLQTGLLNWSVFVAGSEVGLLSTGMIAINNLRDIKGDRLAKKWTLAARFGKRFSRVEITMLLFFPFLLNFFWVFQNLRVAAFLPFVLLPLSYSIVRNIWREEPGEKYNQFLAECSLLYLLFGSLLSFGFFYGN